MAKILPPGWELPETLRVRVGARIGRQRAMFHDGHALLLLHAPPKAGERERRAVVLWRDARGAWSGASGPSGAAALRTHLEGYASRLEELERRLLDASTARLRFDVLRELRPIARAARNLHAVLQDVRTAIPEDLDVLAARDRAYDLEREAAALHDEASAAMQLGLAEDAEEQARASERIATESHRLNLLAAICLPITALGSILGMNVQTGLEHVEGPLPFVAVLAIGATTGALLYAWVRRPVARPAPAT